MDKLLAEFLAGIPVLLFGFAAISEAQTVNTQSLSPRQQSRTEPRGEHAGRTNPAGNGWNFKRLI